MKRLALFIISYSLFIVCAAAQPMMRDVFAAMPDSVLPMVTKNNRLDCIDFIENNMEAKVRNVLDEWVTLEALTSDYARLRTSASSLLELKLLPTSDSTAVLCVVTTAQMGEEGSALRLEDSNLRFLNADWSSLPVDTLGRIDERVAASVAAYIREEPDTPSDAYHQAVRSLAGFHPRRMAPSPDDTTLTITLQTAQLSKEEREAVSPQLQPLRLSWNGKRFIR